MIGLSLSLCVKDVIERKVPLGSVEKLIVGTCFPNPEVWKQKISEYREEHWNENPDLAERIVRRFLAEGKIEQPRLENNMRFPLTKCGEKIRWVESEDKIKWSI